MNSVVGETAELLEVIRISDGSGYIGLSNEINSGCRGGLEVEGTSLTNKDLAARGDLRERQSAVA